MTPDERRFQDAIERIDTANAEDPAAVVIDGETVPSQLRYGRRMTEWLARLYPDASEPLRLAARAQHLRRWMIPRDTFPIDRAGYHRWRTTLYTFHADEAEKILRAVGYDDATVTRVRSLLKKERLKADPETQALEDVICLVFLEDEFEEFAGKHEEGKVINILRRTWAKMSERGHRAALGLKLADGPRGLIEKALAK